MLYIGLLRKLNFCNFLNYSLKKKSTSLKMFLFFKKKDKFALKNNIFVNNNVIDRYFTNLETSHILNFLILSNLYKNYYFNIFIFINGGGLINQLKTIELAIHRILRRTLPVEELSNFNYIKTKWRSLDLRRKERKKFGLKKARKASQYHKR